MSRSPEIFSTFCFRVATNDVIKSGNLMGCFFSNIVSFHKSKAILLFLGHVKTHLMWFVKRHLLKTIGLF